MWKNMGLTGKIIVAMILGIILGLLINYSGLNSDGSFINNYVTDGFLAIVGKLFVNSLKMLVVPLVLISLICGVCGMVTLPNLRHLSNRIKLPDLASV